MINATNPFANYTLAIAAQYNDTKAGIEEAEKKLKTWHLDDCTLYTTLEPCIMCSGAIIQSRISKVFIAAKGERWDGLTEIIKFSSLNHYPKIQTGILEKECSLLISQYFQSKRHHL